jgi:predicted permease
MRFPWNRKEADLQRELEYHLHELTAEYERAGHSHGDALSMAKREFGGAEQVKERCRDERRFAWATGIRQDLTFAHRQFRRSSGFVVTAVLILSLGIAANVIVFGVLQSLILRPIDLPQADRVMTLAHADQPYPFFSYPEVRDVRDRNTVFSAVAAFAIQNFGLEANGTTRPVWGAEVSGQYFAVVGIKPFLGRLLQRTDDDHPGASDAAVLSWPTWKSDFGADPKIVGKTIRLNKHPYTIVGVTPQGFYGTEKIGQLDIFVSMTNQSYFDGVNWLESRRDPHVYSIVRIKEGVGMPQVQTDLNAIAASVARQYPKEEEKLSLKVTRPGLMGDFFGAPARGFLAGVLLLSGILLLAACANLGGLFAARTADRTREIAIRLAIGASRWRIVRQLLVEAILISILGGACACALAWIALAGLTNWHPPTEYPASFHVAPQLSLIPTALLISLIAGVVFGAMPVRQIFKADPNESIKCGGIQTFAAGRHWALRDLLLAAQIALCCVTVTAAFVSLRGLGKALNMDLGIQPKHAVVAKFELSQAGYSSVSAKALQRQLLDRVLQLPGVQTAGYASTTPLSLNVSASPVFSQQATDFSHSKRAFHSYDYGISPGFLSAAGTPLLAGRDVSFADTATTPPVAVVNQQFARHLLQSDNALGRYFKNSSGVSIQIVGLVADGKYFSLTERQQEVAFYPILQRESTETSLVVRLRRDSTDAATQEMAATLRKTLRALDPAIPVRQCSSWDSQLGLTFFVSQVATVTLGLFGGFGLLLSIAGTFGLASYTVSKRMRELSIRIALGAEAKQILLTALGHMLILLASGSVVGIFLGVATSRILSVIVYQASAQDPLVLLSVALTMLLTGLLSVASPVRRALRIDPATLLREQ